MEIRYYEKKYLDSLNELLREVFKVSKINKNNSDGIELVAVYKDKVVGYLNLNKLTDMITGQLYFYVNYVCVRKDYRGRGVATSLFQKVFDISKELGISYLELTSNQKRIEAHELYKKLGFMVRETTVFRKELD